MVQKTIGSLPIAEEKQCGCLTVGCSLSLVIGRWSLVVGHWSLVVGHWSLVVGIGIPGK